MASVVDFLETLDGGKQDVICSLTVVKGEIKLLGGSGDLIAKLRLNDGILLAGGKWTTPADGEAFLRALPRAFSGSRLRARIASTV